MSPERGAQQPRGRLTAMRRRLLDRLLDELLDLPEDRRGEELARCRRRAPRLASWLGLLLTTSRPHTLLDGSARHLAEAALAAPPETAEPLPAGSRLGPWRVIAPVGAGGMGEVYRAERADGAFDMQVAVKVIRMPREDLGELLAAERQMMARLDHASIARLMDGGVTDDGRPYLVMEWVEGRTLEAWIRECRPGRQQCLDVFAAICAAVAAAHRQLVVHGDIKPANLAVSEGGQVKLLDFGVARLADQQSPRHLPGALTPGYAAPEQRQGQPAAVATDIYSLGAVLYWMVFGDVPGDGSSRLPLPQWRRFRRRDELLAIISRATAPDPEARYATANALLQDLGRLTGDRPVHARPPGAFGHVRLWVRRHRLAAAFAGLALAALTVGVSTILWQARIVALERDVARTEAELSAAVRDHLVFMFREVGSLSDDTDELTARELLDRTAGVAGRWLEDDPGVRQSVLAVLGEIMIALNDYAAAEPLLAQVMESEEEITSPALRAGVLRDMAQVLHRRGELQAGHELADRAAGILADFPGEHAARRSDVLQVRGRLRRDLGRWEAARTDLEKARELAAAVGSHPVPLQARAENNLATTLVVMGKLPRAADHLRAAVGVWQALGREDSADALAVRGNLATVLERLGEAAGAEHQLRRVIELRQARFGDSGALAAAMTSLGRLLVTRGQWSEAGRLLARARGMMARFVGESTPDYAASLVGLGELAHARGRLHQAREYFAAAGAIMTALFGPDHPYSLQIRLAEQHVQRDLHPDFAATGFESLIERVRAGGPPARTVLASALCRQAEWAIARDRPSAARAAAGECLDIRDELGLGGWRVTEARTLAVLAGAIEGEAERPERLQQLVDTLAAQMTGSHPLVKRLSRHAEEVAGSI